MKTQLFKSVKFVGSGNRELADRDFEMAVVEIEGAETFEISGQSFSSRGKLEHADRIPVARSDTIRIRAPGAWTFIAHVVQEVPFVPGKKMSWEKLPRLPFPTSDEQVVDCMPFSWGGEP